MGGVCTIVETVLTVGFVGETVTTEVLKAKIKGMLQDHKQQVQLMNQLQGFVDKILGQKNLISQLNANVLFATDNWNTIFDDLEDKNTLIKKISDKFPNVKTQEFDYTWKDGLMTGGCVLMVAYMGYIYATQNVKAQVFQNFQSFKTFCKNSAAKIRGTAPSIQTSKVNEITQQIQVSQHGTIAENIPAESKKSGVEAVKDGEEGKGPKWKGRAVIGLRVAMVLIMAAGFVLGAIAIADLVKQFDYYRDLFAKDGGFQKSEDGVIALMDLVASDIFTLANCSRAALHDSKNMFYVKAISNPSMGPQLELAKDLDPTKLGLTQKMIDDSKKLLQFCNQTKKSGLDRKTRLQNLKNQFQKFFNDNKPEDVFLKISEQLSGVVGKYSVISSHISDDVHSVHSFLTRVADIIDDSRGVNFDKKTAEEKKKADIDALNKSFEKYKTKFDIEDVPIQKASLKLKNVMFQSIISYVDSFYYDDPTGKTLFGIDIASKKAQKTYAQILSQELSETNVVPVCREKQEEEKKEVQKWMQMALGLNEKMGNKFWGKDDKPKPMYRFIRISVSHYFDAQQKKHSIMSSFEGILIKNDGSYYRLEKNELTDQLTLQGYKKT